MGGQTAKKAYVAAVSGGVDSMALLDLLVRKNDGSRLIVAHFDHGIREDSAEDRRLVGSAARRYALPFVFDEGRLGAGASEAAAREARYRFLRAVQSASGARAIITAHHEDDLLETAILNLLRGTGRKGLAPLGSIDDVYRPLLGAPKQDLIDYARANGLRWREDSSNARDDYVRNYVRHHIMPRLGADGRERLKSLIERTRDTNVHIDARLAEQLRLQPASDTLDRQWFTMLPRGVAKEIMAAWLRGHGIRGFDAKMLERLASAARTLAPGKQIDVCGGNFVQIRRDVLALMSRHSVRDEA